MGLYEIEIHRNDYAQPVDMQAVYNALKANNIDFDPNERRNNLYGIDPDEIDEQPEYVYVDNGSIGEAVRLINELGYTTDEDEDDDDEEKA